MIRFTHPARGAAVLVAAALVPAPAFAWKHIDDRPYAWKTEDLPIRYYVAREDTCEETVPPDYCVTMAALAHEAWDVGAPCAGLGGGEYLGDFVYFDDHDDDPLTPLEDVGNAGFVLGDNKNHIGFNDPFEELEVGVLAANLTLRQGAAFQIDGVQYQWAVDSDIVFNNNVDFATHTEIVSNCLGRTNMLAVAIHEVGHLYGMGHSCEQDETCTNPVLKNAIMNWTSEPCDARDALQPDDIEGINALYGPSVSFSCSNEVADDLVVGKVPLDLKCVVASQYINEIESAVWTFGNGESATGNTATTTYTEPGNYTVELNVTGRRDDCVSEDNPDGEWPATFRKIGYVRACGLPVVEFTVDHVDGLKYEMVNSTDVSVYGCIQDIEWQVYKGGSPSGTPIAELTKKAWDPLMTFPGEGTYTIVVNVGGLAGTSGALLAGRLVLP